MPWRELAPFLLHPVRSGRYLVSRYIYPLVLRARPGVTMHGKIEVREFPLVSVAAGGRLVLGIDVKLNSRNENYHINMHSPVKLIVGAGATLEIGDETRVHGTCIHALREVRIGKRCLIAANTQIIDNSGHDLAFPDVSRRIHTTGRSKPVVIEDDVWIGANCIILPGVTVGTGSVIGAGSVVTADIPPFVVAGGNPAVVRRSHQDRRPE